MAARPCRRRVALTCSNPLARPVPPSFATCSNAGNLANSSAQVAPVAVRDQPAADPAQALWLGHHEDGPATHEDLVGHGLTHARPGDFVEGRQQGRAALAGGLRPAAEFGHAGGALAQRHPQEAAGDGEADALGLGDGGELGLAILVENDGVVQAPL